MQPIQFFAARAEDGALVPGATVDVYVSGTQSRAALFADSMGVVPLGNPVLADKNARVFFYSAITRVDIQIHRGAYVGPLMRDVVVTDPDDVLALTNGLYRTVSRGLAATINGQTFQVISPDNEAAYSIFENVGGVAVDTGKRVPDRYLLDQVRTASQQSADAARIYAEGAQAYAGRNFGPLPADPASNPLGEPLEAGDRYFNTVMDLERVYNGSIWSTPNADGQAIQLEYGDREDPTKGAFKIGFRGTSARSYLRGSRISTTEFGLPADGETLATEKFKEIIARKEPLWLDGIHLIEGNVPFEDLDLIGPGELKIVVGPAFQVTEESFMFADSVMAPKSGLGRYKVNLRCRMTFRNSAEGKPHTPIRFAGLLPGSVIELDYEGWGSGDVTQTNAPDFYFNNEGVEIRGSYVTHHRIPGESAGGMWIRDVFLGTDTSKRSSGVIVKSGTYIESDGKDEALAIFVPPAGGKFDNCGVEAAVIKGRGIGVSVLDLTVAGAQASYDTQAFLRGTIVHVSNLRQGQGAIKFQRTNPNLDSVTVFINGVDDVTAGATFTCGFRNAAVRGDLLYPTLSNCRVILNLPFQPARELRAFDNAFNILNCSYETPSVARFTHGIKSEGAGTVNGGVYSGALIQDVDGLQMVANCTPRKMNNITFLRTRDRHERFSVTTDASGFAQIPHGLNKTPSYVMVQLQNRPLREVQTRSLPADENYIYVFVFSRSTGNGAAGEPVPIYWEAKE